MKFGDMCFLITFTHTLRDAGLRAVCVPCPCVGAVWGSVFSSVTCHLSPLLTHMGAVAVHVHVHVHVLCYRYRSTATLVLALLFLFRAA